MKQLEYQKQLEYVDMDPNIAISESLWPTIIRHGTKPIVVESPHKLSIDCGWQTQVSFAKHGERSRAWGLL